MKWVQERIGERSLFEPLHGLSIDIDLQYSYELTYEQNLELILMQLRRKGFTKTKQDIYVKSALNLARNLSLQKYSLESLERQNERSEAWRHVLTQIIPNDSLDILVTGINNGREWLVDSPYIGLDLPEIQLSFPCKGYVSGSVNKLPFPAESFDCYVSFRTLQSAGVLYSKALDEAKQVLRKGGEIIISFPTIEYKRKGGNVRKAPNVYALEECSAVDLDHSICKFIEPFTDRFSLDTCYRYISEDILIGSKL